ncbi:MAG: hypothetical protein AUI12_13570 [Acidobacteria bacterium 13_2_20CM_2_57_6]|nr:MAG: hypothetical protein AUI12_13570 [Acidobacteria bacterium 13_2_20CM_2_57_6]PYT44825.1 MAG: hypothetical protein DMG45_03380 [Acidobacteriota bacterium]PYT61640.1 MAG: hypothetical protein DMG46_03825 [Acidobacteriota bacterium]
MKRQSQFHSLKSRKSQAGISLIETTMALGLLLVVSAGILGLGAIALSTTENQGHLAARTAEYAQDKMEQLLALRYGDTNTDTTVFPAVIGAGPAGLTPGGSLSTTAPVAGYVDYLDKDGNLVAAGGAWEYIRVWQITENAAGNLKTVSVLSRVRGGVGQTGQLPRSTVVAMKSSPF